MNDVEEIVVVKYEEDGYTWNDEDLEMHEESPVKETNGMEENTMTDENVVKLEDDDDTFLSSEDSTSIVDYNIDEPQSKKTRLEILNPQHHVAIENAEKEECFSSECQCQRHTSYQTNNLLRQILYKLNEIDDKVEQNKQTLSKLEERFEQIKEERRESQELQKQQINAAQTSLSLTLLKSILPILTSSPLLSSTSGAIPIFSASPATISTTAAAPNPCTTYPPTVSASAVPIPSVSSLSTVSMTCDVTDPPVNSPPMVSSGDVPIPGSSSTSTVSKLAGMSNSRMSFQPMVSSAGAVSDPPSMVSTDALRNPCFSPSHVTSVTAAPGSVLPKETPSNAEITPTSDSCTKPVAPSTQDRSRQLQLSSQNITPQCKINHIATTAFDAIVSAFSPEILKVSSLTGKRGLLKLNPEKISVIKQKTLAICGADESDWANSCYTLQIKLRNFRTRLHSQMKNDCIV